MIRKRYFGLLGAVLITLAGDASPGAAYAAGWVIDLTGNELNNACQDKKAGTCSGFVIGVVSGLSMGTASCWAAFPDGVISDQIIDIVANGLKNHPEERQLPAALLVRKYVAAAWPCK